MTTGCILAHYKLDKALYHFLRWLNGFVGTKPLLNEPCRIAIVRRFTVGTCVSGKKKRNLNELFQTFFFFSFLKEQAKTVDFLYVPICAVSFRDLS